MIVCKDSFKTVFVPRKNETRRLILVSFRFPPRICMQHYKVSVYIYPYQTLFLKVDGDDVLTGWLYYTRFHLQRDMRAQIHVYTLLPVVRGWL